MKYFVMLLFSQASIASSISSIGGTSGVGKAGRFVSVGVGVGLLQAVIKKQMNKIAKKTGEIFTG
jgi:hypothetical protein